ncbi:hypothetical protein G9A89_018024 [Geosiphon pyriformis]|nr:hypothetical protein G9A89_018024 [Geosiphon pyriformis]
MVLNWTTQELQLSQNGQYMRVPASCDHFKSTTMQPLIDDWVRKETPIEAAWKRAVKCLNGCLHNDNKIWQITLAKIKDMSPEEIRIIKNNSLELIKLD